MLALEAGLFEPLCVVQRAYFLIDAQILLSLFHERKLLSFIVDVGKINQSRPTKCFFFFFGSPVDIHLFILGIFFLPIFFLWLLIIYYTLPNL